MSHTEHLSSPMVVVDSHQHVWQLDRGDYRWLTPKLAVLYRDFTMDDLTLELNKLVAHKTVLIQAAETAAETQYLLDIAAKHDRVCGVVGWIDMESPKAIDTLSDLRQNLLFKGIRPMLQDLSDVNWVNQERFTAIFAYLARHNLSFDALVKVEHLSNIAAIARQHPSLKIVINHCAKPSVNGVLANQWMHLLADIASCPNVSIKLSGLMTEAPQGPVTLPMVRPYFEYVFSIFGEYRIMWGSDWPVIKLNGEYKQWFTLCKALFAQLSVAQQQRIWSQNACEFYNFADSKGKVVC